MEISAVCGSEELREFDFGGSHEVRWNGRVVKENGGGNGIDFQGRVAPRMSRPNRTDVELEGEYRQDGNGYIKGKGSVGWDWPQPSGEAKGSSRETNNDSEQKNTVPYSEKNRKN